MTDLYGLILAGGKSSRMGFDKGMLKFQWQPQREFLFELLSSFCGNVFTSCRADQEVSEKLNPIVDRYEIDSPLNGILSAFDSIPSRPLLTVPVDMPYISQDTIRFLIKHRDQTKTATCFYDSEGVKPEPLLTIWEASAHALLLDFYRNGKISPREFLVMHSVKMIETPDPKFLVNVNTAQEFEQWKNLNSTG